MTYAAVALPLPVEETYTYRVPDELETEVRLGSAVVVPFGRRLLTGVVTRLVDTVPEFDVKDIRDTLDSEPVLTGEQIELTRWISEYYLCGWGESIRAALPPGIDASSEFRIMRSEPGPGEPADLTGQQRELLESIPPASGVTLAGLRRSGLDVTLSRIRSLETKGLVQIALQLRGPRTRVLKQSFVRMAEDAPADAPRGKRQRAVLDTLAKMPGGSGTKDATMLQTDLIKASGASSSTIRRLEELGYVAVEQREVDRSAANPDAAGANGVRPFDLNQAQRQAVDALSEAVQRHAFRTFLLHGITGSGKTEVYIEAVQTALEHGKSAIILVPEISLTPQTVARFRSRFGAETAVLHSRMSPGERYDAWRGIRSGNARIVIGPRSAVLAPVRDLGLIVVDEEHEPSYKQYDPAPRYHARDVAIVRARNCGAVCLLGSATPSLESLANARAEKYTLLELPDRVETAGTRAVLPHVRVVDLRTESRRAGARPVLSEALKEAIGLRLTAGHQTILLQNRRGYAPLIMCEACNWVPECPDCSVSMTWHKAKQHLRCHYCGRTARLPRACPSCSEPSLVRVGIGTQRVEEEIEDAFPDARVVRMDLDTTSTKNAHHTILDKFAAGKYDILLGTQMVAKGLDFGRVTLVGVIDADAGLTLPDIRAEERAFHLLTQVAGRAGRADLPGEVIFQTRNPGHRILQFAIRHDYNKFAREILAERAEMDYPPFGRLAALLFTGPSEETVYRLAERWIERASVGEHTESYLGPSAAFVGRVRKQYRMQVLVKIPREVAHRVIREKIRRVNGSMGSLPRGFRLAVDIDPVSIV